MLPIFVRSFDIAIWHALLYALQLLKQLIMDLVHGDIQNAIVFQNYFVNPLCVETPNFLNRVVVELQQVGAEPHCKSDRLAIVDEGGNEHILFIFCVL